MRILLDETAALLIDEQERLFPHIHAHEAVEQRLLTLGHGLRVLGVPLLTMQQYTKGLGPTIPSLQAALREGREAPPDAPLQYIEKLAFSCCGEPAVLEALRLLRAGGRSRVLLAGIETHVCVLQTAVDLLALGWTPVVIEDCVSSRRASDKRVALQRLRAEGALISTSESILFELTRTADSEQFRAISRLVK